jgi:hypothetical protein
MKIFFTFCIVIFVIFYISPEHEIPVPLFLDLPFSNVLSSYVLRPKGAEKNYFCISKLFARLVLRPKGAEKIISANSKLFAGLFALLGIKF